MDKPLFGPETYRPHGPRFGQDFLNSEEPPVAGFYQPPSEEQIKLADILPAKAESQKDFDLKLDDYQAWGELNWKSQQGTIDSTERLTQKLAEEVQELTDELRMPPEQKSPQAIVSELGDILWCVNGLASNLSVNVKHGLQMLLDDYSRGTRYFHDPRSVPPWVKLAQRLTYNDEMSATGLADLVEAGYEPQVPTNILIDEPEDNKKYQIHDAIMDIDTHSKLLVSIAKTNYEPHNYHAGTTTYQSHISERLVAYIYLDVAFLARYPAGGSLNEVIRQNILKLSGRVATNSVDKSDGPRHNA
jgi:NTP pyrophosphatase (non-canonical NTP hydrolase)